MENKQPSGGVEYLTKEIDRLIFLEIRKHNPELFTRKENQIKRKLSSKR